MRIVLVTGSRDWDNKELLEATLEAMDIHVLIEGGARGADQMSEDWAKENRFRRVAATLLERMADEPFLEDRRFCRVDAEWDRYHKGAGPIRNTKMVRLLVTCRDKGHDCKVVAFHENLSESRGTKDCFWQAANAGFRPILVNGRKPQTIP